MPTIKYDNFHQILTPYLKNDTSVFDILRQKDYARLDEAKQVYLDYTGGSLYAMSPIQEHQKLLQKSVLGNPHSINPSSSQSTALVEETREAILEFFHASSEDYVVIFTSNASGAFKLVAESYPFSKNSVCLLSGDSHNSVLGMREFAKCKNAQVKYVPLELPDLRLDQNVLHSTLVDEATYDNKLFAYPAQSNFSGVQHDLTWIDTAQMHGWDVLLDAAAFVPTNPLDLRQHRPNFVAISFYKMFGYPTGIGCLLARKDSLQKLRRPWFAGGTISVVSVQPESHHFHDSGEAFEDGTLDYLNIPAVKIGLDYLNRVGIDAIHDHVANITQGVMETLLGLEHSNGVKLVTLYGPPEMDKRGGTLALNFFDKDGQIIDRYDVEKLASAQGISLRTGCFCNPGSCEQTFNLDVGDVDACATGAQSLLAEKLGSTGKHNGAVRVSFGIATNLADAATFLTFAASFLDT